MANILVASDEYEQATLQLVAVEVGNGQGSAPPNDHTTGQIWPRGDWT